MLPAENVSKCKDSSTVVDGKNSEKHLTYVVDSTV